jgi:hypothetical protein
MPVELPCHLHVCIYKVVVFAAVAVESLRKLVMPVTAPSGWRERDVNFPAVGSPPAGDANFLGRHAGIVEVESTTAAEGVAEDAFGRDASSPEASPEGSDHFRGKDGATKIVAEEGAIGIKISKVRFIIALRQSSTSRGRGAVRGILARSSEEESVGLGGAEEQRSQAVRVGAVITSDGDLAFVVVRGGKFPEAVEATGGGKAEPNNVTRLEGVRRHENGRLEAEVSSHKPSGGEKEVP